MVVNKIFSALILTIFLISLVNAQSLNLSTIKTVYSVGDRILIYATVHNSNLYNANFLLTTLLINDKDTYPKEIFPFEFQLDQNGTTKILVYNISVDNYIPSDIYSVKSILYLNGEKYGEDNLQFEIKDTLSTFLFNIKLDKKIFVHNEEINIGYTSEVSNPEISVILIKPDGSKSQISIPTIIKAEQIGTYELEITASKEGYKTMNLKEQFGVITRNAVIQDVSVCNVDGVCSGEENYQNCPQDCAKPGIDKKQGFGYIWILFGLILIVVLVIFYLIYKKRSFN